MGTGEFTAGGNPRHPIQGGVEILLVTSCYGNRPDVPLGLSRLYCSFVIEKLMFIT